MINEHKPNAAGRPKSIEKRQQILHSAGELLLSLGYYNTSMDAVAKASGVSKQTVYSHFANKDALYNAIIERKCAMHQIEESSICIKSQSLANILSTIGLNYIKLINDENVIAMYKLVIGESKQDSHVAKLFYEAGPLHSIKFVASILQNHPQSQLSSILAKEVSHDFFNLLESDFHMPNMLHLASKMNSKKEQDVAQKAASKTMAIINLLKQS